VNIEKISDQQLIQHKYRSPTSHVFSLITNRRKWIFACKSSEECDIWINRILYFIHWKDQIRIKENLKNFNNNFQNTNDIITKSNDNNNRNNNNNNLNEKEINSKIINSPNSVLISNSPKFNNETNKNNNNNNNNHNNNNNYNHNNNNNNNHNNNNIYEAVHIGVFPTIMRKLGDVGEWMGITEPYSVITSAHQKSVFFIKKKK